MNLNDRHCGNCNLSNLQINPPPPEKYKQKNKIGISTEFEPMAKLVGIPLKSRVFLRVDLQWQLKLQLP